MTDLANVVPASQVPRPSVTRSAAAQRSHSQAAAGGRSGMLDEALRRVSTMVSASSYEHWRIRTPGTRRIANIDLSSEWLSVSLPLRQLSSPISPRIIDSLMRRNARIDGNARIVGQRRPGRRQIVVDMPVELLPWEDAAGLDTILGLAISGLDAAVGPNPLCGTSPAQVGTPRERIEASFEEAGWPAQPGEGDGLEVPLEVPGSYFSAGVTHDYDATRLSVPILPNEYHAAAPECRGAVSVLIWLTASRIRMIKPVRSRRVLALEAALMPAHSNASGLAHGCAALSVALQRCAAEAALLLADEALARFYLSNFGLPTSS